MVRLSAATQDQVTGGAVDIRIDGDIAAFAVRLQQHIAGTVGAHAGVVIQAFVNHDAAVGAGQHNMAITAQRGQVRLLAVGNNRDARIRVHLRHADGHRIHRNAVGFGDEDARTVAAGAQSTDRRHRGGQVTVTAGDSVIRFQT